MAPAWGPLRSGRDSGYGYRLKRLQAKWTPVRVKKTRQIKNLEPRFDSNETEMALNDSLPHHPAAIHLVFEIDHRRAREMPGQTRTRRAATNQRVRKDG